ncbi:MAG: hypothetical protein WBE92_05910 [Steroidobacteraceae bacterium]
MPFARHFVSAVIAAGVLGSIALAPQPAAAQAYGERSAVVENDCGHDCLIGFARRYMDGLVHHDPSRVPFAKTVEFTENDVVIPIGSGLWGSISAASPDALLAADPDTGNVAWLGSVEEHGAPAYYAMRLEVRDGRITEVETVVDRKTELPAPFGDPSKVVHDPAFAEVLPAPLRRERERLRDVANGYFSTVERNDGDLLTLFDPDCERTENGISTTRGRYGSAALAQGCEAQFKLGIFRINKRVRERRYPLIDVQRGVVVATGFFDHDNSFDRYTTTDGKEHRTLLKWPNSLSLMEAFEIRGGKIYRVEAIFTYAPYFMHSPWAEGAGPPASKAQVAASGGPAVDEHPQTCDRACLIGLADRYMEALAAHDPSSLPWAKIVRYTENSVPMNVGEGQWGSVTGKSADAIEVADPATGNVAWLGSVEEHGDPAYYGMRLTVRARKIAAVEAVIDPQKGPGRLGDPARYIHDLAFKQILPASERSSRTRLIALARSHLEAGLDRADQRLRDPRFSVVDAERGVVVTTAFIDHGARRADLGTNGKAREPPYPDTLGLIEALKIRGGRIDRTETIYTSLPYAMPSPWVQ